MKRRRNLKKLMNLNMVDYTNKTTKCGDLDMPYVCCNVIPTIDYLASYSQPSTYFMTENTAVSFFEFDITFDGLYGLWNAIYYGIKELQEFYIERFKDVRYFISPDMSKCGDISEIENLYKGGPIAFADYYILNNGTKEEVIERLKEILEKDV